MAITFIFVIASAIVGFLLCAHLMARRCKCSTAQVVRETPTFKAMAAVAA